MEPEKSGEKSNLYMTAGLSSLRPAIAFFAQIYEIAAPAKLLAGKPQLPQIPVHLRTAVPNP